MALKLLTRPSGTAVFFTALGGVILAALAVFLVPASAGNGGEGAAAGAASRPASGPSRATSQPVSSSAARQSAQVPAAPAAGEGLAADEFPETLYGSLLDRYLADGLVDYEGLAGEGEADLRKLVDAIASTDAASLEKLRDAAYIAWYSNAYNILTLQTIVDHYPIQSILSDIEQPWDSPWTVAGRQLTLNQIEHDVLRRRNAPMGVREAFVKPRVHFILNCASIGCPVLQPEPFNLANLDELMDQGVREFVAEPGKFRFEGDTWYLSELLNWYGEDFLLTHGEDSKEAAAALRSRGVTDADKIAAVALFFADYVNDEQLAKRLRSGEFDVEWLTYDWGLNGV